MKSTLLTAAILCLLSTFTYSQFTIDVSSGLTHRPSQLSSIPTNGFYLSTSPSIALEHNFRFRTTVQFRRLVGVFQDAGNIDVSPEIEYTPVKFLSLGTGVYYSYNLNRLQSLGFNPELELGPVGYVKFRLKDAFAMIRYSKPLVDEVEEFYDSGSFSTFNQTSRFRGYYQFGLGYTFGKK